MKTTNEPTHKKILLASLSAMAAETVTFPIDTTKTRLQLLYHRSAAASTAASSAFSVAGDIVRHQGILGLYQGLSSAIIRHLFYTPIRIVGYEQLRSVLAGDGRSLDLVSKGCVGGISGVIAQVIASPADLVKVRMQADSCLVSQGLQPRYSGPIDAFHKIIREEGFRSLWKGVIPNAQRAFLVNMGELACYDHAKHFVIQNRIAEDNVYAHTLASVISGLAATTLSCPADVVKTRMMNQEKNDDGMTMKYRTSYECVVKTIKFEGVRALWKGFLPTWARLGPWQFIFWVSYEKLRHIVGLSSF